MVISDGYVMNKLDNNAKFYTQAIREKTPFQIEARQGSPTDVIYYEGDNYFFLYKEMLYKWNYINWA